MVGLDFWSDQVTAGFDVGKWVGNGKTTREMAFSN